MEVHAQSLDLLHQQVRARIIDLARHEARRKLDDVGFEPEVIRSLGRLQAEQAAPDHGAASGVLGVLDDGI